ncbi:MAG: Hsp20/alpha crystallin family protein [Planctomycetaceae bacterium]|nr:MAG: Hsp20/alpha crystallin family protein [Planctomycetaceae bacterium]
MPVFRWGDSWESLRDLERQVDRLLEELPFPLPLLRLERKYPPINLYELPDEYVLTSELPGNEPGQLEVTVAGGVLTLKGERSAPAGVSDDQYRRHERVWGKWERAVTVPERIREDGVRADFQNGVLQVHLPKAPEARPRQIQVASPQGDGSPQS